ncbi:hypothetical protein GQ457_05G031340 [Hibiscus cannabinus]
MSLGVKDHQYRYPNPVPIPLVLFFTKQIPESILSIDTQGEYRYPRAELAGKTSPTAPNKSQRSPTARNTFGTIKQASKHQEKANASLYNINMIKNCLSA